MSIIRLGISCGDLNGVGLEVALKAFANHPIPANCTPIFYGSTNVITNSLEKFKASGLKVKTIDSPQEAELGFVNVIECWEEKVTIEYGKSTKEMGNYSYLSLSAATNQLVEKQIEALITCPINKNNIQSDNFNYPGHTEYLAHMGGDKEPLMLMTSKDLSIAVVTGHIPVTEIATKITKDLIIKKAELLSTCLEQDFGINKPNIAILGLNPHAGDNGTLGKEEITTISPAIAELINKGINVEGPFPADGLFGSGAFKKYDGILAMYHDQGLIPFKALTFNSGVNFTAALPFVRTSPDHGTAFEIAGKNQASELSFHCAILKAVDAVKARRLL
ncbi:MAG: 4-hydroxythreonine-4-phosphate dehydrogenase PdxA [Flavobacteriales bacterium]|nr:4-hydroxythreonine-4-phosphate dehydrogenase PdxA [Flavobacteriales bacterium]